MSLICEEILGVSTFTHVLSANPIKFIVPAPKSSDLLASAYNTINGGGLIKGTEF